MLRLFTLDTRIFLSFFFSLSLLFFPLTFAGLYLPLDTRYRRFSWEIGVSLFDVTRFEVKVTSKIDGSVYVRKYVCVYTLLTKSFYNHKFMDVQMYRVFE